MTLLYRAFRLKQCATLLMTVALLSGSQLLFTPWIESAHAQMTEEWAKKLNDQDAATLAEEKRLDAYKDIIPELHRRAKEALEKGDKANYKKYANQLKQTLQYMDGVFAKKYGKWFTPHTFEEDDFLNGNPLNPKSPLGVHQIYRRAPEDLEAQRKEMAREETRRLLEGARKEGFVYRPLVIDPKVTEAIQKQAELLEAMETCDPALIIKLLGDVTKERDAAKNRWRANKLRRLRPTLTDAEKTALDEAIKNEKEAIEYFEDTLLRLRNKLKTCGPKDKSTESAPEKNSASPQQKYQYSLQSAQSEPWSRATKPLPLEGEIPSPVSQQLLSKAGDWVMTTPSPSSPESQAASPLSDTINQLCDMIVSTYRQNLMASVDEGWHAPKPPAKGVYIAKFTYGIQADGSLALSANGDGITLLQSSGYGPIDQSARARIIELFGPGAPTQEQGGFKRKRPSCYQEQALPIDHTFKVIYR